MIKVDRQRADPAGRPINPSDDWFEKARRGAEKALQNGRRHKADVRLYAAEEVRRALEELFHRKCAYCEAKCHRQDWDVEHYRPKGRVQENAAHPGYFWVCYDWDNLFLSCTRCNQFRKERKIWPGLPGTAGGKGDSFPLSTESSRVMTAPAGVKGLHDGFDHETRLLLNPCQDDPAEHLTFNRVGSAVAINSSDMATASVAVFNLNEPRLERERRELIRGVLGAIKVAIAADNGWSTVDRIVTRLVSIFGADHMAHAGAVRAIREDPIAFGLPV